MSAKDFQPVPLLAIAAPRGRRPKGRGGGWVLADVAFHMFADDDELIEDVLGFVAAQAVGMQGATPARAPEAGDEVPVLVQTPNTSTSPPVTKKDTRLSLTIPFE